MSEIDDIKARHAAACPGPWEAMHGYIFGRDGRMVADDDAPPGALARARGHGEGGDRDLRNLECIAALHGDVAFLLAEVERLQADSTRERGIGHRCMARLSNALAAEPVAYERGLRRGMAIARGAEMADGSIDWYRVREQMEREIEEAKR